MDWTLVERFPERCICNCPYKVGVVCLADSIMIQFSYGHCFILGYGLASQDISIALGLTWGTISKTNAYHEAAKRFKKVITFTVRMAHR